MKIESTVERDVRRDMEGRQTLVTGAATPIGRALVEAFARRGAMVIAVDADEAAAERAIRTLDLADPDAVVTRGLRDESLGAWWDLSNLVAAYYHALDVLVHVPQTLAAKSLPLAAARLAQAFANADDVDPGRVAIFATAPDPEDLSRAIEAARAKLESVRPGLHIVGLESRSPGEIVRSVLEQVASANAGRIVERSQNEGGVSCVVPS